jgi:phytoene dehydrogenase-like protein
VSGPKYDVVVVGAGPNGLSAAIALARAKLSTLLVEANETAGGGARTHELTLPGFLHDACSSVHPLGMASPFFRTLKLEEQGVVWIDSPTPVVHLLDDGTAVRLERSIEATGEQFGPDAEAYRRLVEPFVREWERLLPMILGPLRFPSDPLLMTRFGLAAVRSMEGLARDSFRGVRPAALLAGIAAHAMLPLDQLVTASFGLVLATAGHAVGWPIARGGSQAISDALVACFREHGGTLQLGSFVERIDDLPPARAYVFDVTPRQLLRIAGAKFPRSYVRRLERFRYGPGVFKMDWALSAPIPWRDPACARACTVHLAGDLAEVSAAERAVHDGKLAKRPFVLLVQPSLFDATRAPAGQHTAWAYCHTPHGATLDASAAIEAQIERFAPGFRDVILARSTKNALEMQAYNANYIGGDINGGLSDIGQLFFRPVAKPDPYATPAPDVFVCSSSTPPGGGVHGMCGYWAARSVLRRVFGIELEGFG